MKTFAGGHRYQIVTKIPWYEIIKANKILTENVIILLFTDNERFNTRLLLFSLHCAMIGYVTIIELTHSL